jgi:hypothetical protein
MSAEVFVVISFQKENRPTIQWKGQFIAFLELSYLLTIVKALFAPAMWP